MPNAIGLTLAIDYILRGVFMSGGLKLTLIALAVGVSLFFGGCGGSLSDEDC
ncbi:MAG: hypothetical protein LBP89_02305 [Helicobacteraceae bacterium]|nr:hypothetical protein [Helicobacteraceae bacterium]